MPLLLRREQLCRRTLPVLTISTSVSHLLLLLMICVWPFLDPHSQSSALAPHLALAAQCPLCWLQTTHEHVLPLPRPHRPLRNSRLPRGHPTPNVRVSSSVPHWLVLSNKLTMSFNEDIFHVSSCRDLEIARQELGA